MRQMSDAEIADFLRNRLSTLSETVERLMAENGVLKLQVDEQRKRLQVIDPTHALGSSMDLPGTPVSDCNDGHV